MYETPLSPRGGLRAPGPGPGHLVSGAPVAVTEWAEPSDRPCPRCKTETLEADDCCVKFWWCPGCGAIAGGNQYVADESVVTEDVWHYPKGAQMKQRVDIEVLDELGHVRDQTTGTVRPREDGGRELVLDTSITVQPGETLRWTETWEARL